MNDKKFLKVLFEEEMPKYKKEVERIVELEKNVKRESDNEIVNLIIGKYTKLQMENIHLKRKIKKLENLKKSSDLYKLPEADPEDDDIIFKKKE